MMAEHSPEAPRILVFGATGGIGTALTRLLADRGCRLVLSARGGEKLDRARERLGASVEKTVCGDSTSTADVDRVVGEAVETLGGLDGVAHLVGSILLKPGHLTSDDDWATTLEINLGSAFRVLRASVKALRKEGGSIVLVSTAAARIGLANHEAIAAAKGGVEALARSAAASYASRGIRVNCVAPGLVDTPLAERITGNERALATSRALHPVGRIGDPGDVARAVAFLLDPDQSWLTGQVLGVDGGLADLKTG